ncbi:MAG: SPOR domain-containing protein [Acetobacteraceae bacterium]
MSDDLSIPSPTYRVPRQRQGLDPGTKRLVMIAGGLGGVLLVTVGAWSFLGHRSTVVPVLQADNRPIRVKPENPGGMQVAGVNEDILSGGGAESKDGKLAPPPEVPAPQALRAPPPVAATPVPATPMVAPHAAPNVAAPATPPKLAVAPAPARPAVAPEKRAGGNGALVQLAAVRSEDAAKSEWQRLSKRVPELLGPHKPAFSKTERDGQTLWRVRTGGFNDASQATAFCEKVRAKGLGCTVAEF